MPGLVAGTLESAAFEPERFDGLVIWDVLEHLYNLVEVMEHYDHPGMATRPPT